jgi:predicted DNA-binding protein (UPF0251 family)
MARPHNCRRINEKPDILVFKPAGVPSASLAEVTLGLDELEAIRLADLEGMYQEDAARVMNVSRQTFGRILAEAHAKVARALVEGNMLIIEGGTVEMAEGRQFFCSECDHAWQEQFGTGRPEKCPKCGSLNIHRDQAGFGRGRGGAGCRRRKGFGGGAGGNMGGRMRGGRRGGGQ